MKKHENLQQHQIFRGAQEFRTLLHFKTYTYTHDIRSAGGTTMAKWTGLSINTYTKEKKNYR